MKPLRQIRSCINALVLMRDLSIDLISLAIIQQVLGSTRRELHWGINALGLPFPGLQWLGGAR